VAYLFHLVGDGIGVATLFYHPLYQGPTGFFIIFDGGLGIFYFQETYFYPVGRIYPPAIDKKAVVQLYYFWQSFLLIANHQKQERSVIR